MSDEKLKAMIQIKKKDFSKHLESITEVIRLHNKKISGVISLEEFKLNTKRYYEFVTSICKLLNDKETKKALLETLGVQSVDVVDEQADGEGIYYHTEGVFGGNYPIVEKVFGYATFVLLIDNVPDAKKEKYFELAKETIYVNNGHYFYNFEPIESKRVEPLPQVILDLDRVLRSAVTNELDWIVVDWLQFNMLEGLLSND